MKGECKNRTPRVGRVHTCARRITEMNMFLIMAETKKRYLDDTVILCAICLR